MVGHRPPEQKTIANILFLNLFVKPIMIDYNITATIYLHNNVFKINFSAAINLME